jgi:hypothetical protein
VSLDGTSFPRSVVYRQCGASRTWTYALGGKFDRFRTAVGVPAGGDPARTKQVTVKLDGSTFFSGFLSVNDVEHLDFSVAGRQQLSVTVFGECGDPKAYGALGRPRVLR